jgi:hypothetical protein
MRPFSIVEDEGFNILMKTGRPNHYLPKRRTVARDVKEVFKKTRKRIKKLLKVRSIVCNVNRTEISVLGSCWSIEFCDRRLDIAKSQSLSRDHCTFRV